MADGTFIDDVNTTLGNIDAVQASKFLDEDDGGRLATYGGTGVYSGGAYDVFRRSGNIEDRRLQKHSQNPAEPPETIGREQGTGFDYDYYSSAIRPLPTGVLSNPLSQALGINDVFKWSFSP